MGEVMAALRASGEEISGFKVRPADLAQLLDLVRDGTISHTAAKRVFARMVETGKPAAQVAADEGLLQVGDESAIATWVDEVLEEHPDEAKRYLSGEKKLQGVLVGFVMKKSKGPRRPQARESVVVGARRVEGLGQLHGVLQRGSRHSEVLLRLLVHVFFAAAP